MAGRRKNRGKQREIGAAAVGAGEVFGVMTGGGDDQVFTTISARRGGKQTPRPMHAIGADRGGKVTIARHQKQDAARAADRQIAPCDRGASRCVIVAKNHGCARRQRAKDRFWVKDARAIGQEGEIEGRRCVARAFERTPGGC